jgi:hypothetical protein
VAEQFETRPPPAALFVTVGSTARRLLDASGALGDYPRRSGRKQARLLDTDRAAPGERFYGRALKEALALVPNGGELRLFVVAWAGRASGVLPLLTTLTLAQRLKADLELYDVELDRWLLLTLPSLGNDRHAEMLVRSTGVLLSLTAASRFGAEVIAGQQLIAPIVEWPVVVRRGPGAPVPLEAHLHEAGAVLRLLFDPGPLGLAVRGHMERLDRPGPVEASIFFSITIGSLVLDHEPVVDLLTDLTLARADEFQVDRLL